MEPHTDLLTHKCHTLSIDTIYTSQLNTQFRYSRTEIVWRDQIAIVRNLLRVNVFLVWVHYNWIGSLRA